MLAEYSELANTHTALQKTKVPNSIQQLLYYYRVLYYYRDTFKYICQHLRLSDR